MEELKNGRGLSLQGVFELVADGLADFVGQAVFEFGEDTLVDDGPHQLVVEVALSLSAPSLALAVPAVLDVEEAQVQGYEVVDGIASTGNLGDGCRMVGKCLQLSRAPLEGADGWPPCILQLLHAFLHRLVDELLADERIGNQIENYKLCLSMVLAISCVPSISGAVALTNSVHPKLESSVATKGTISAFRMSSRMSQSMYPRSASAIM